MDLDDKQHRRRPASAVVTGRTGKTPLSHLEIRASQLRKYAIHNPEKIRIPDIRQAPTRPQPSRRPTRPFVRQSTYEGYRAAISVHLIPGTGRHQLASLKPEHLERLYIKMLQLTTRRGTPMRPARVHQVHRTIRAALNEAVRRGYITRNPAAFAKTPAVEEYEVQPYDVADVQAISGPPRTGATALAGSSQRHSLDRRPRTWLRQGEALGIRWPDIDWDRQLLAVRRGTPRPRFAHGCAQACGR